MKWLTNASKEVSEFTVVRVLGESYSDTIQQEFEFRKGKIFGRPKATETYSVEQLEAQGLIGIYGMESYSEWQEFWARQIATN